ncbi:MAG: Holliday junction branch migration protein RuvA, partial [Natronohydrobacter sp.]|nr:Holliday junction branch migration protein RuvA [Natronohydrobacter sp.]
VGYIVHVSERTLMALPGRGEVAALYTELVVREDLMQLFGFQTLLEKEWHRVLTSVQGVGAKASLAILGALGPEGVSRAIALGDAGALRKAPGVGPKLALRIANELKDKAPALMAVVETVPAVPSRLAEAEASSAPVVAPSVSPLPASNAVAEAMSALGNLGYSPSDAARAVAEAQAASPEADTPALIRAALRLLAPKG